MIGNKIYLFGKLISIHQVFSISERKLTDFIYLYILYQILTWVDILFMVMRQEQIGYKNLNIKNIIQSLKYNMNY